MVLAARRTEESAPINPQQIDQNVNDLYKATEGQMGTDELQVCAIICTLSLRFAVLPLRMTNFFQHLPPPLSFAPSPMRTNAATNALLSNVSARSSLATWKRLFSTWCTVRPIPQR